MELEGGYFHSPTQTFYSNFLLVCKYLLEETETTCKNNILIAQSERKIVRGMNGVPLQTALPLCIIFP